MAKSGLTATTFLDALVLLLASSNNPSDEQNQDVPLLIDNLCNSYLEEFKINPTMDSILNRKFVNLLKNVRKIPKGENYNVERSKLVIDFIQNNKPVDDEDDMFFTSLKQIFEDVKKIKTNDEICKNTKKRIKNTLTWSKYRRLLNNMYNRLNKFGDTEDAEAQAECLSEINTIAKKLVDSTSIKLNDLSTLAEERIVMSDKESLETALSKLKEEETVGILRTGLVGLNRMLGYRKGFARGEFVVIYGLQHHFKTGMLLTITRGICKYNDPKKQCDPNKKPLILLMSLENYARKNLYWFYEKAWGIHYGTKPKQDTSLQEMIDFIQKWYMETGWEFIIERYSGRKFGYDEYVETIEKYESLGYEVIAVCLDYMSKMKRNTVLDKGKGNGWASLDELCDSLFQFNKSKEILFITPHQFNRDMAKIAEQGKTNTVKYFGYSGVSGSSEVARNADLEISVYIEKDHKKQPWLTVQRGKHRYVDDTPEKHKYFAYKFDKDIGIPDDINDKEPKFVEDIYAITGEEDSESTAPTSNVF